MHVSAGVLLVCSRLSLYSYLCVYFLFVCVCIVFVLVFLLAKVYMPAPVHWMCESVWGCMYICMYVFQPYSCMIFAHFRL